MQILPYVGHIQISQESVRISVNPADKDRVEDLVMSSCAVTTVKDQSSYMVARSMAAKLKSMLSEITDAAKAAKRPSTEINEAISTLAADISSPVLAEQNRILGLITVYVKQLEAERAARLEEQRKIKEESDRKIAEAKAAALKAETQAQQAKAQLDLARAELSRQTAMLAAEAESKSLVPGGRVAHPWKYRVINANQVVEKYGLSLFRWELDILACNDEVKRQLEHNPTGVPVIAGLEITQDTKVSIKGSAVK